MPVGQLNSLSASNWYLNGWDVIIGLPEKHYCLQCFTIGFELMLVGTEDVFQEISKMCLFIIIWGRISQMNASKETGVPDFTSIASFRVWGCSTISPQYADSEVGLLLEITGTGLGPRWAQNIKGTGCSNSVPAHSWPLLSQQKKKCIYIWNLRNFQNCCLEDGSRLHGSWMLSAW